MSGGVRAVGARGVGRVCAPPGPCAPQNTHVVCMSRAGAPARAHTRGHQAHCGAVIVLHFVHHAQVGLDRASGEQQRARARAGTRGHITRSREEHIAAARRG